jgi:hypothetical protein
MSVAYTGHRYHFYILFFIVILPASKTVYDETDTNGGYEDTVSKDQN